MLPRPVEGCQNRLKTCFRPSPRRANETWVVTRQSCLTNDLGNHRGFYAVLIREWGPYSCACDRRIVQGSSESSRNCVGLEPRVCGPHTLLSTQVQKRNNAVRGSKSRDRDQFAPCSGRQDHMKIHITTSNVCSEGTEDPKDGAPFECTTPIPHPTLDVRAS